MSFYSLFPATGAVFSFLFGCFVLYSRPNDSKIRSFSAFCFSLFVWLFGYTIAYSVHDWNTAFIACKIACSGATFTAPAFYHFAIVYTNKKDEVWAIRWAYLLMVICVVFFLFTDLFIKGVYKYFWGYYSKAGVLHPFYLILFFSTFIRGFWLLFIKNRDPLVVGAARRNIQYVFFAYVAALIGAIDYIPKYGIEFFPFGFIFEILFILIVWYAIAQYRLMDIRLAISNTAIFIAVYALVLGVPFYIYVQGAHLVALIFMLVLATSGPIVFNLFRLRAENRLLQEQHRYQNTLRQASAGMGKIKDLKKLLHMIVYVLTHAVQIEHALIYIYDEVKKQYILGASKRRSGNRQYIDSIEEKSPLVAYLLNDRNSIIFEEIKQKSQDYKESMLAPIIDVILSLEGELIVPIFIDRTLISIVIMGKKENGKMYNQDDIGVFSILANQTALAIENAKFYEDMKKTHQQLFQAEKMATIGTMADGLSHQINNRFHALGFIAGDALDTIQMNQKDLSQEEMKEVMAELHRAFVRVQDNVVQGGEIVQGLLKYTRKGESGFAAVDVQAVFKSALEMAQFKIKTDQLKIIHDYDPAAIPKIKGNFTQLQEVFFNLIDNGYDAMMQRKNEAKEPSYQPTLIVHVLKEDNFAQIIFEDNGMGVKDDDMHKLFTPFFTTKLSSKKGTGLGLYVIKKIVEDNHGGQVEMVSKYMQGTQMKLRLPIAIG